MQNKNRVLYLVFWINLIFLSFSCDLDDESNRLIPNYSELIANLQVNPSMNSDIIILEDDKFLLAIEDSVSNIYLVEIIQKFEKNNEDGNWILSVDTVADLGSGKLIFFDELQNDYLLGFTDQSGAFKTVILNSQYSRIVESENWMPYIDTAYNQIDSLHFNDFSYGTENSRILLGGEVYTQGTSFSCALNLDIDLNPVWFRTYFEKSDIQDLLWINKDSFLLLNNSAEMGSDLLMDNSKSDAYVKFDLNNDSLFFGAQSINSNGSIYLSGIQNRTGRILDINVSSGIASVNEVEIYPIIDFRAVLLSSDSIFTTGIQMIDDSLYHFTSQLYLQGSLWCKRDYTPGILKILDLEEMKNKGMLISSIVKREEKYFIHLTRIDDEGVRFDNEFTETCL